MNIEQELEQLPDKPGVYILYDSEERAIYVGKARSLKRRVPAHFRGLTKGQILTPIGQNARDIEVIVTANESEALVLEDNLIKSHKPRFNVRLKDDKSFPYLRVTLAEDFPRAEKTRNIVQDGSRYFGPYSNVKALDGLIKSIIRVVPLATCRRTIIPGKRQRPCLKYDIGRCVAPCVSKISKAEYSDIVSQFILMLTGRHDELEHQLRQLMASASKAQEYEKAARFRDRLHAVQLGRQAQRATIWNKLPGHRDVIGFARKGSDALIQLLVVRAGRIVGQQPFPLNAPSSQPDSIVLEAFLKQYYLRATEIPNEVIIPAKVQDKSFLEKWLTERRKDKNAVRILHPTRGPRKRLVDMANENAQFHLQQLVERIAADELRLQRAYSELVEQLQLPQEPQHIEGFDVSTIQGTVSVGVCVVFRNGLPSKKEYRRFKIREITRQDDFAMMHEIVKRRYHRLITEKKPLPDLILIDGGRGHVNMARKALQSVGADQSPILGLAKGDSPEQDLVYVPWQSKPVQLAADGEGLRLLQRVRDEAHRFAIAYHRTLRRKKGLKLVLTEIPGIGIRRASHLMQHFGSLDNLAKASLEEIAAVPTMTRTLAQRVHDMLASRRDK
ncbi:MAG: excinuclease ABC subunit UvrC [Promethearchaeota archaeon]